MVLHHRTLSCHSRNKPLCLECFDCCLCICYFTLEIEYYARCTKHKVCLQVCLKSTERMSPNCARVFSISRKYFFQIPNTIRSETASQQHGQPPPTENLRNLHLFWYLKVKKVKLSFYPPGKHRGVVQVWRYEFLTSAIDGGVWLTKWSGRFTPPPPPPKPEDHVKHIELRMGCDYAEE
jgi:hypothetical protein